jgi:cellulose synthase/poly-beta-1,6-N-acetylglucosamine synthase-like glycosyltransferase
MLQFNGTAGVWRRQTIEDAGGWEADTLTEDLDLSIRAQLKGWEIVYLEKFESPAELPAEMNGYKAQQFRWMKGGAETARKIMPILWQSAIPLRAKLFGTAQLLGSSIFVFVFTSGILSVPLLVAMPRLGISPHIMGVFLISIFAVGAVFFAANVNASLQPESLLKKTAKFVLLFPLFLALSMGLSLHNTVAVLQGYLGKKSPFIRTPKFNIQGLKDTLREKRYINARLPVTALLEGLLALYFLGALMLGVYSGNKAFLLFHLLLTLGFGSTFFYTIRQSWLK